MHQTYRFQHFCPRNHQFPTPKTRKAFHPPLDNGYYVPHGELAEKNDWYGKDMVLTKEQAKNLVKYIKDVVISIGTKPGPMNLPSFDEYLENIMTVDVDKQIYEDMFNMRKKMIMEKVKERRIMKGKKKGFRLRLLIICF